MLVTKIAYPSAFHCEEGVLRSKKGGWDDFTRKNADHPPTTPLTKCIYTSKFVHVVYMTVHQIGITAQPVTRETTDKLSLGFCLLNGLHGSY